MLTRLSVYLEGGSILLEHGMRAARESPSTTSRRGGRSPNGVGPYRVGGEEALESIAWPRGREQPQSSRSGDAGGRSGRVENRSEERREGS